MGYSRQRYEKELETIAHNRLVEEESKKKCLHCKLRAGGRRYGLCSGCYLIKDAREIYKGSVPFRHRGVGLTTGVLPRAPFPADAMPGTFRKVVILEWRAEKGYHLWHPEDMGDNLGGQCTASKRIKPLPHKVPMAIGEGDVDDNDGV